MDTPERFDSLPDYAFPRLRRLLGDLAPGACPITMSIGEPTHGPPAWLGAVIAEAAEGFGRYPANEGTPELLQAISDWIARRAGATVPPDRIMALNGSREGALAATLALCPETRGGRPPLVAIPNPFYQAYGAAALAAGAEPVYLPATAETGFLPDVTALAADTLDRLAIVWVCSPSNPQGAVADEGWWRDLLELAQRHGFRVFADECYSEIYAGSAPPLALGVAEDTSADPETVVAFNSLSKRSSVPGLRSGFVAAGSKAIAAIRRLRAYAGAPLPVPLMAAAERLWADEGHVAESRSRYARSYAIAREALGDVPGWTIPAAGFFLWLPVDHDEAAARAAWAEAGVAVLPGRYLSRATEAGDPGAGFVRAAMVAGPDELHEGLMRLRRALGPHLRG